MTISILDANGVPQTVNTIGELMTLAGAVDETAPASDTASSGGNGRLQRIAQNLTTFFGAKVTAVAALGAGGSGNIGWLSAIMDRLANTGVINAAGTAMIGFSTVPVTVDVAMTRAADSNAYAANDAWSNSASAPTAGGYTVTGAARASGGAGRITDLVISSTNDPATPLQGELWIFDSAPTAINDNAAFTLSDADSAKVVTVIPFTLNTSAAGSGANSIAVVPGPVGNFTCVGTANLRCLVKVKNAYAGASAEVLTARFKIEQLN